LITHPRQAVAAAKAAEQPDDSGGIYDTF